MKTFEVPKVILSRYDELYDLVTNKSVDGEIAAIDLAKYLGKTVSWVRNAAQNGRLPYAFGDSGKARNSSYIGVLPFYQFETHNQIFVSELFHYTQSNLCPSDVTQNKQ